MMIFTRLLTIAIALLLTNVKGGWSFAASSSPSQKTVVITGATGKAGSRLIRQILENNKSNKDGNDVRTVALVRNATKARSMFDDNGNSDSSLIILEADFSNPSSLESALSAALAPRPGQNNKHSKEDCLRLFLACANGPDQATLELNVARTVATVAKGNCFCVKLSTAQPLVEHSIGVGAVHRNIEEELKELYNDRCAMLRPNLFSQMFDPSDGGSLLGVNVKNTNSCQHAFADSPISVIDVNDVAACAASILLEDDPAIKHGAKVYELTGPRAEVLSDQFAKTVSSLRPSPISIQPCSIEEQVVSAGMPLAATERIAPFLNAIRSYNTVTDTVEELTGRPATSVSEFIRRNPRPFLPQHFRRLVATGQASSFREAAKIITASLDTELDALEDDEMLVRVQAAGVNGGADTFGVTRASADAKNFILGNEGAGVVVLCGKNVTRFQPSDTAVFVASGGYGEYVRVKEARCPSIPAGSNASPAELTALRISALTALVALQRTCPVQAGDVVLVTACCGGTGHFAVQIAKAAGAIVIGTVGSTAKAGYAQDLGIDRIVDLSKENLGEVLKTEYPQGIDIAYEGVGGALLSAAFDNLSEGGRILVVGSISQYPHNLKEKIEPHNIKGLGDVMDIFRSGQTVELDHGRKLVGNVWGDLFASGEMGLYRDRVFDLNSEGKLRVVIDPNNSFVGVESVCDAVDHMLNRGSVGKVCVEISAH